MRGCPDRQEPASKNPLRANLFGSVQPRGIALSPTDFLVLVTPTRRSGSDPKGQTELSLTLLRVHLPGRPEGRWSANLTKGFLRLLTHTDGHGRSKHARARAAEKPLMHHQSDRREARTPQLARLSQSWKVLLVCSTARTGTLEAHAGNLLISSARRTGVPRRGPQRNPRPGTRRRFRRRQHVSRYLDGARLSGRQAAQLSWAAVHTS